MRQDVDISKIPGNCSDDVKGIIAMTYSSVMREASSGRRHPTFGEGIADRIVLTDVSMVPKAEEKEKQEARVVCELDVDTDMLNGGGNIHGGCSAFLVDWCSTMAIATYTMSTTGTPNFGVSQSMSLIYHSPAALGEKLRIVNTSMTIGARAMSARTEIWNATHHRLVVSGTHIKMAPSQPKNKL